MFVQGESVLSVPESTHHIVAWSQACLGTGLPRVPAHSSGPGCLAGQLPLALRSFPGGGNPGTGKLEKKPCTHVPAPCTSLGPSLPRAGALPVGGRTGCVYTLEAASGVEAHLARPTLDAIFLTLVDVWAVGCGRRWEGRTWERKTRGGHVKETSFLRWSPEERPSLTPLHLPGACLGRAWFIGTSSYMGEVQTEENSPGRGVDWPWLAHPGSSSHWEGGGSQRGRGNSSSPLCFGRHADTGSSHGIHQGLVQVGTEGREMLSQIAAWPCALRPVREAPCSGQSLSCLPHPGLLQEESLCW